MNERQLADHLGALDAIQQGLEQRIAALEELTAGALCRPGEDRHCRFCATHRSGARQVAEQAIRTASAAVDRQRAEAAEAAFMAVNKPEPHVRVTLTRGSVFESSVDSTPIDVGTAMRLTALGASYLASNHGGNPVVSPLVLAAGGTYFESASLWAERLSLDGALAAAVQRGVLRVEPAGDQFDRERQLAAYRARARR